VEALWGALDAEVPAGIALRRDLHREPDGSGDEARTSGRLAEAIGAGPGRESCGARMIRIGGDGPAVAVRAELDALPLRDATGVEWASVNGFMHACGHDVHMAGLATCARAIAAVGPVLPLLVLLQPREEVVPSGAADLVEAGALLGDDIRAMIGVHVQPRIPAGTFSALAGSVNSSADEFDVTFTAHGGHAGYPHTTGDPVLAAASLVTTLQSLVSRRIDPLHPAVVSVGSIHAGDAPNVIPDSAALSGTIRAFDADDRQMLQAEVARLADAVAAMHGCQSCTEVRVGEPPLVNHPELTGLVDAWISHAAGLRSAELRSCGADDFAYYGELFPSTMVFYGIGDALPDSPGLHHPRFLPSDDDVAGVARCQLAAYLAACELVLGPIKEQS
jgi:amidohydrolase